MLANTRYEGGFMNWIIMAVLALGLASCGSAPSGGGAVAGGGNPTATASVANVSIPQQQL